MSGSGFKKVAGGIGKKSSGFGKPKPPSRSPARVPPPKVKSKGHFPAPKPRPAGQTAGTTALDPRPLGYDSSEDQEGHVRRQASRRGCGCLALAVLCLSAAVLLSCSLFDPRDPEDPDDTPPFWQYPYNPAIVMLNVHGSMEARSITLYMACMDTSFTFLADPADTSEWGGSWEFGDWDYYVEQSTMGNIFALQDTLYGDTLVAVAFTGVEGYPDPPAPVDSATIWRDYTVVVAPSIWGPYGNPARGRARITMVESSTSTWSIRLWEDFRPEFPDTSHTLGVLKASYR